jgi:hypothetical protein
MESEAEPYDFDLTRVLHANQHQNALAISRANQCRLDSYSLALAAVRLKARPHWSSQEQHWMRQAPDQTRP